MPGSLPMQRRALFGALALLAVAVVFVYAPIAAGGFVRVDDPHYVSGNEVVQRGLTIAGARWAFTTFHASNWHPLTWLSHMLDCELFGLEPRGHHLASVALHLAAALLLWLAFARLSGRPWRSWFVAALFALHPLHVESVAWISERKDVLSALFFALVLLAYERYARAPGTLRMAWVALFLALGLMSKPMLVTVPGVLLLLDIWPLGRGFSRARVLEKWPLFVLSAGSSVVTFLAQREWGAVASLERVPLAQRAVDAVIACTTYLRMAVWPADLCVHHPHAHELRWASFGASLVVLAVITIVAWRARSKRPCLLAGWLWYLGMLVPVIGLVQVGSQSLAERYTYLPLLGPFVAGVWLAGDWIAKSRAARTIALAAAVAVLLPLAIVARRQAGVWHDSLSLFERAVRAEPGSEVAHQSLGDELVERGRLDEGIAELRAALLLAPDYEVAHNGLGVALQARGEMSAGLDELRRATALAPGYFEAWFNLGIGLFESGDLEGAAAAFARAVALRAWHYEARANLASTLARLGRTGEARTHCIAAARLVPDVAADRRRVAEIAEAVGDPGLALDQLLRVLELAPLDADACEHALGLASATGESARAAELARQLEHIRAGAPGPRH